MQPELPIRTAKPRATAAEQKAAEAATALANARTESETAVKAVRTAAAGAIVTAAIAAGRVPAAERDTHTTALANVNNTAGKLTTAGLDAALYKARYTSSGRSFVPPAMITTKGGIMMKAYVALLQPLCARDLLQSAGAQNLIVYRDADAAQFDIISGANYIGKYKGILLYEQQPIEPGTDPLLESGVGAGSINVGHNLLLGAKAAVMSFGSVELASGKQVDIVGRESQGRLVVTREVSDHGGNLEYGMTMVVGQKKLVDGSSGTNEDFGVVHFFNAAVES
jgi:hypothetical protein